MIVHRSGRTITPEVRIGTWIGRPGRAVALLAVGAAGGGAAFAIAAVPGSDGVIHACYAEQPGGTLPTTTPNLRVIDPSAGQSCSTPGAPPQGTVDWNVAGPPGAPGPAGRPGAPGPAGKTETFASGSTITFADGNVVTVGGSSSPTIAPLPFKPTGRPAAEMDLGSGAGALDFGVLRFGFAGGTRGSGTGSGTGSAAGKTQHGEFVITKLTDTASPKLAQASASGKHFPTAKLIVRKAGGIQRLEFTFKELFLTSIQWSNSGSGGRPEESITFEYGGLVVKYVSQSPTKRRK